MTRPRLELAIGVTGHRASNLAGVDLLALRAAVSTILAELESALHGVGRQHAMAFDAAPPRMRLVSALADGADTLVAQAALAAGWRLDVCLPFVREEYAKDFELGIDLQVYLDLIGSAGAVMELPGRRADAAAAYEAVGRLVLEQSDILIALWDGDPNRGRGGTSRVVAEAIARRIPVIHVATHESAAPKILWSGLEIADFEQLGIDDVPRAAATMLPMVVAALTEPPHQDIDRRMLQHFHAEHSARGTPSLSYPVLLAATGVRSLSRQDLQPLRVEDGVQTLRAPLAGSCVDPKFFDLIVRRYGIADVTGTHFAQVFRSGFVGNYLLAGLAVVLALSGLIAPAFKLPLIVAELGCVGLILINIRTGKRLDWHERWMDNRHLAEQLRSLALSSLMGDLGLRSTTGTRDAAAVPGWVGWLARATARETGLPDARIDENYLRSVRDVALQLIDDQLGYHRSNAARMNKLENRLARSGEIMFGATVAACIGWIIFKLSGLPMGSKGHVGVTEIVTFTTASLPALASAIYGIRNQGDFAGGAFRSRVTVERLEQLRRVMVADPLEHPRLLGKLRSLSDIMLNDVANWRTTFKARPLTLPG